MDSNWREGEKRRILENALEVLNVEHTFGTAQRGEALAIEMSYAQLEHVRQRVMANEPVVFSLTANGYADLTLQDLKDLVEHVADVVALCEALRDLN